MKNKGLVILAAGGTGGHLFPAEALAHELIGRGYNVHLVTDSRAERFAGRFPASAIHVIPSATIGSKNPIAVARAMWRLFTGYLKARSLFRKLKPLLVAGFGGYPTVPPLFAASALGIPTLIHEQNAVMGRANKALASRVRAIAGGFLIKGGTAFPDKTLVTGNPVRPAVLEAARRPYVASETGPFNLVVFGGSQGAQFFSQAIPEAIGMIDADERKRLHVTQQARPEDAEAVKAHYKALGVDADVSPFFTDMAERIGRAHYIICRSGASTVSELSVIGRPSILVPYPYALDHDQAANAAALEAKGGAKVIKQADLSPEMLSVLIHEAMNEPQRMAEMAAAAAKAGQPAASALLADLAEAIAQGQTVKDFKGAHS